MSRLQKRYEEEVIPKMQEKFGIKNRMAVPRLNKIVVNMGVGRAMGDMKILESAVADLTAITGQKAVITKAKKAISNFKLRIGMPIGCKVTLRRTKMYEFMDRLVNVTLPRIRDFNGVSFKSFDKEGNYSIGLSEQAIFPEMDPGKISNVQGMDITFVFNRGPKDQTLEVLSLLGMPFRKKTAKSEQM
ncbi:MAG: 50S ribosomal protein L5 [Candidatus Omnitrophica bacterium]|nr:50S ribosomal protein L5 [Candidatus Omnitrophota bacterium]